MGGSILQPRYNLQQTGTSGAHLDCCAARDPPRRFTAAALHPGLMCCRDPDIRQEGGALCRRANLCAVCAGAAVQNLRAGAVLPGGTAWVLCRCCRCCIWHTLWLCPHPDGQSCFVSNPAALLRRSGTSHDALFTLSLQIIGEDERCVRGVMDEFGVALRPDSYGMNVKPLVKEACR